MITSDYLFFLNEEQTNQIKKVIEDNKDKLPPLDMEVTKHKIKIYFLILQDEFEYFKSLIELSLDYFSLGFYKYCIKNEEPEKVEKLFNLPEFEVKEYSNVRS